MSDSQTVARSDANHCFVCGPENPIGLQIEFHLDQGTCVGTFTPTQHHVGFDNVTHGGLIFSVLDDAMANWFFLQGARGYTARAEIRYRAKLPIGVDAAVHCEMVQRKRQLIRMKSTIRRIDNGETIAESDASFMLDDAGALGPA